MADRRQSLKSTGKAVLAVSVDPTLLTAVEEGGGLLIEKLARALPGRDPLDRLAERVAEAWMAAEGDTDTAIEAGQILEKAPGRGLLPASGYFVDGWDPACRLRQVRREHPAAFPPGTWAEESWRVAERFAEEVFRLLEAEEELVASRPEAFRPDLARSLGARAMVLEAMERGPEALDTVAEGLGELEPLLRSQPAAVAGLATQMVNAYFRIASEVGIDEPDPRVAAVVELLAKLREAAEAGEGGGPDPGDAEA